MIPERVLGEQIPISVPTAIPFEEVITELDIKHPTHLFMNVETLARNFWTVFPSDANLSPAMVLDAFLAELDMVINLTEQAKMTPVFYHLLTGDVARVFKAASLYALTDTKQKEAAAIKTLVALAKRNFECLVGNYLLPNSGVDAYMLTHKPVDLLSTSRFNAVSLLESHTGAIKTSTEWIRKLTKNDDYQRIPFNLLSYQVFGDRLLLAGQKTSVRKALLTLAKERRWNPATPFSQVRAHVSLVKDNEMRKLFSEMCNVKLT